MAEMSLSEEHQPWSPETTLEGFLSGLSEAQLAKLREQLLGEQLLGERPYAPAATSPARRVGESICCRCDHAFDPYYPPGPRDNGESYDKCSRCGLVRP